MSKLFHNCVFCTFFYNKLQRFTSVEQCFTDRAINEWRHRMECVVQQQGGHTEHCFWMNPYNFVCLTLFMYSFVEIAQHISWCNFWATVYNATATLSLRP